VVSSARHPTASVSSSLRLIDHMEDQYQNAQNWMICARPPAPTAHISAAPIRQACLPAFEGPPSRSHWVVGTRPRQTVARGSRSADWKPGWGGADRRHLTTAGRISRSQRLPAAVASRRHASGHLQLAKLVLLIVVPKASGSTRPSSLAMSTLRRRCGGMGLRTRRGGSLGPGRARMRDASTWHRGRPRLGLRSS
jgi:hypothetical protein